MESFSKSTYNNYIVNHKRKHNYTTVYKVDFNQEEEMVGFLKACGPQDESEIF